MWSSVGSWWSMADPRLASVCSATSKASLGRSILSPRLGVKAQVGSHGVVFGSFW